MASQTLSALAQPRNAHKSWTRELGPFMTYNDDGDPKQDIAKLLKPNSTPAALLEQTIRYTYTPNRQLAAVDKIGTKAGGDESYERDVAGNVTWSSIGKTENTAKTVTKSDYANTRLVSTTPVVNGVDQTASKSTYHYDDFGRLDTVTASSKTVASYTYDGFDRIIGQTQGTGASTVTTTSAYDPFGRVSLRTVDTGTGTAAKAAKTRFNYLGLTGQVAAEERSDATHGWQVTKAYTYGPGGNPLALVSTPLAGESKTRYYSVNPHGDTETLTDPVTGLAMATYRYTSYGSPDDNGTLGEDAKPTSGPVEPTEDVLNPYRYSSKRIDPASGSYDMGFRTYNPGLSSFLTRDMYNGALGDQGLGLDPWNTNRYAYAGGNPVSRVEVDGHQNQAGATEVTSTYAGMSYPAGGYVHDGESLESFLGHAALNFAGGVAAGIASIGDTALKVSSMTNPSTALAMGVWKANGGSDEPLRDLTVRAVESVGGDSSSGAFNGGQLASMLVPFGGGAAAGARSLRLAEGIADAGRAANAASRFGSLTHSSAGIAPFSTQRLITAGQRGAIQAHHLIERRFARQIGGNTDDWATIVVTRSEHQVFTNAWRQAITYGAGTRTASRAQIEGAARQIYSDYPEILRALGLG